MTHELKLQIVEAAQAYCKEHSLKSADLSRITNINDAYISLMLSGKFKSGETDLSDKWFAKLAGFIGFQIEKEYWVTIQTNQFLNIIPVLEDAKKQSLVPVLIGYSGCGKTFSVEKFCKKNPLHTYKITVSSLHKLWDILHELMDTLNIERVGSKAERMIKIILRLREIKMSGGRPMIIIDEAENMELPALKMLKALYDGLLNYCSIALIGTDELTRKLEKMNACNKSGMPQLYRRLKAGIAYLPNDKNFTPFFEQLKINDIGLRKLLIEKCNNYGELHDFVSPALREAERLNQPLTEDLFRTIRNMPKFIK